jgi:type I restriction enzyme S subunit
LKISGCINDGSVAMLDIASNVSKDFLYYFFTHMTKNYRELMQLWSGQPNLNTEIVKSTMLSVPDLEEQVSIAAYLDRETTTIDALIAEIETGIAHLKEYRTALISAAVTGQIDVRDALHADAPV